MKHLKIALILLALITAYEWYAKRTTPYIKGKTFTMTNLDTGEVVKHGTIYGKDYVGNDSRVYSLDGNKFIDSNGFETELDEYKVTRGYRSELKK